MVHNTCPQCGAVTDNRSQKFCTRCGTKLPDPPWTAGTGRAFPVWIAAAAGIIGICILAAVLWAGVSPALPGTSSAGPAAPGSTNTGPVPADLTPLPTTPIPVTTIVQTSVPPITTASPTPLPETSPAKITPATTSATSLPTTEATTVTTRETATPSPEFTTQITLSVTRIPSQPPSDTVASKTPGAPYIDPTALETRIHELINIQRQQNGLLALSYDSFLANIARGHSYDMALRNYFEHTNPDGMDARARGDWAGYPCVRVYSTYISSGISENIAMVHRYDNYRNLIAPNGTIVDTEYDWSTQEYIADKVVNGWMNSEGHRENILDYHFQQEGIGVSFSSDDKIYVTENFC